MTEAAIAAASVCWRPCAEDRGGPPGIAVTSRSPWGEAFDHRQTRLSETLVRKKTRVVVTGAEGVSTYLGRDAKGLQGELGVTRAAAEAIMRRLPVVQIEGLRKTYVRRSDVAAYLEAHTLGKNEVAS